MPKYAPMHNIPVLLLNVKNQDYLQMLLRRAKIVAELQWYTANSVSVYFTCASKMR